MMSFKFEWNTQKAETNLKKHGVSFEEAMTVFDDAHYLLFTDPKFNEDRYIAIGFSRKAKLLVVIHCYQENVIRLISARKATSKEHKSYEKRI